MGQPKLSRMTNLHWPVFSGLIPDEGRPSLRFPKSVLATAKWLCSQRGRLHSERFLESCFPMIAANHWRTRRHFMNVEIVDVAMWITRDSQWGLLLVEEFSTVWFLSNEGKHSSRFLQKRSYWKRVMLPSRLAPHWAVFRNRVPQEDVFSLMHK